jgi:hypothetical protein
MAKIYYKNPTTGIVTENTVADADLSYWTGTKGWTTTNPAQSSVAPAPAPTLAPVTPAPAQTVKQATLYGPNGQKKVVSVGSSDASQLQSQGWGLTEGSYKAPAAVTPEMPSGMVKLTDASQVANYDIKGQIGESGAPGSYLYGVPKAPKATPPETTVVDSNPPTPTLPTLTATDVASDFLTSVSTQVETAKTTLSTAYQQQVDTLKAKADTAQAKIDEITKNQNIALDQVKELTQPFRQTLEDSERERLHINENFEANQKLTDELGSLLTDGNTLIQQMKGVTGLASIRDPRINQAIDAVNARVGVIQAVMNARNGQISQAYSMIDRSTAAITADKNDQLSYYNSLLSFYDSEKATENAKLTTLTANQREYINAQIGILESDVKDKQATADMVKNAMIDPNTALLYAQAGVTLNDSPAEINKKLATTVYTREISTTNNTMVSNGYAYLAPGQSAPAGSDTVTMEDSKGVKTKWYKIASADSFTLGKNQIRYDANGNVIATGPVGPEDGSTTGDPAEDLVISELQPYLGSDGFISPETYNAARIEWTKAGLNPTDFDTKFKGYRNPFQDGYSTGNAS